MFVGRVVISLLTLKVGVKMSRLATCKGCGLKVGGNTGNARDKYAGKIYCISCYEKAKRDGEEYKKLIETICDYYKIDKPTGLMLKQIKEYKNDYNYTYGGMAYTLWYMNVIEQKEFIVKYGVTLNIIMNKLNNTT